MEPFGANVCLYYERSRLYFQFLNRLDRVSISLIWTFDNDLFAFDIFFVLPEKDCDNINALIMKLN